MSKSDRKKNKLLRKYVAQELPFPSTQIKFHAFGGAVFATTEVKPIPDIKHINPDPKAKLPAEGVQEDMSNVPDCHQYWWQKQH